MDGGHWIASGGRVVEEPPVMVTPRLLSFCPSQGGAVSSVRSRVTREPTAEEKQAAVIFLHHINGLRVGLGMKPVATKGKAHSVRRTLPVYFALGVTLHDAIRRADEAANADPPDVEMLYPTRLAKLVLRGEA